MKMEMADSSSYRLETGGYLGEISALCFVHLPPNLSSSPLLLVGSGSQLLLYNVELGKLLNSFHVFQGIRVHGISLSFLDETNDDTSLSTLVVFGETRVKIFTLRFQLNHSKLCAHLVLNHVLPRFTHWVMDVLLIRDYVSSVHKPNDHLTVGLGDNSICLWDISRSTRVFRVRCPEKTLLYSMRLWGDDINSLRVASGTIYNEVIVWKLVSQRHSSSHTNPLEHSNHYNCLLSDENELRDGQYEAIYMNRLAGHEGSIFRLSWSPDGSKLLSVSDDRSARLWNIDNGTLDSLSSRDVDSSDSVGLTVFGHSARVWDCYISDSFIVTAGEDCTCRVWGMDGQQLFLIKEHSGRGIWRCTYDPKSSVLITAGFDASVKVHMLHASLSRNTTAENSVVVESSKERMEVFTLSVPHLTDQLELLNSKSEYVRCLHFTREDTLYVATNNGYLYHVKLSHATDVKWTELVRISEDSPIVCMDILPKDSCLVEEDWIVVGDGRGNATVVNVVDTVCTPIVHLTFTWSAGMERQLLGTYWCKSLGHSYIFTADPKGILKLWNIHGSIQSGSVPITRSFKALLTAEFISCFGTRVVSLDALFNEQVLVCGDQRGNLTIFSLSRSLLVIPCTSEAKYSPIISFKGAHGISSVTSISVSATSPNQIEIRSTGGDGCICFFKYDGNWGSLEFTGMKQVKELSLIQSFTYDKDLISSYAVGFASAEFIVWNVQNEIKVVQVSCGGWRRPHSYYLGDVPESRNCFAFVKDHTIHIHRLWVPDSEKKLIPHVLHMQFHGREIHSLCFISNSLHLNSDENTHLNGFGCIATGCEDGTVRLTRYAPDHQNWIASKLLGEHVGGSAVRSICFVSKIYKIALDGSCMFSDQHECIVSSKETDNPSLLISVGAKRVLTSWLLQKNRLINKKVMAAEDCIETENVPQEVSTSISFQWLSTDMPSKFSSTHKTIENAKECSSQEKNVTNGATCKTRVARHNELQSKPIPVDKFENDWRYLAVTAFLVKGADCRSTVCFIVVSCSDATLTLRALILPYRLWFDVAVFVPQTTPVLSLQNIILPSSPPFQESIQIGCAYILICGATDGSITFWDMTESVQRFMERLSEVQPQSYIDSQKRPRTGRGSQGGRWWRTLHNKLAKTDSDGVMGAIASENTENEDDKTDSSLEICNVKPFHVLDNVHQSGVNCLHVSSKGGCDSVPSSYCVLSGGDDQALTCLTLNLSLEKMADGSVHQSCDNAIKVFVNNEKRHCRIKFLSHDRIISAHSSAIKGVWGDGRWAFSTGLDQRVRCWEIKEEGKLREHTHAIISVTEPETLDARAGGRDRYEIAVAGRGMQMLMFSASHDQPNK